MPRSFVRIRVNKDLKNLVTIERNVNSKKHLKEINEMAKSFLGLLKEGMGKKKKWKDIARPPKTGRKALRYVKKQHGDVVRFYYYSRNPKVHLGAIQYGSKPHWEANPFGWTWTPRQHRTGEKGKIEYLHKGARPLRILEYAIPRLRKQFPYRIRRSIIK